MPDHVHALVSTLAVDADFHRFIRTAKQRSGFEFRRRTGHRLWQDSFFDRTVRDDESPVLIMSYIIGNPVRAGLVRTPEEYPYWGSQVHSRREILDFIEIESRARGRV